MRYLLIGILLGAVAGIFSFQGVSASEILPEFFHSLSVTAGAEPAENKDIPEKKCQPARRSYRTKRNRKNR